MGLPKVLSQFNKEYEQLLLHAHEGLRIAGTEYTVQFDTPNVSETVRMRMYAFIRALRKGERPDLVAIADDISLRTAGCALVFYRKSDAPDAIAIRKALGLQDGFADGIETRGMIAPESGLSTHIEKLKSIRERKNK